MRHLLRVVLSIGVSFAIIALLLQIYTAGVPEAQRPGVLTALQSTVIGLVLAYLALYLVTLMIRAWRYRLLLQMSGEANVPTLRQMALVTGIRNMVVDMLPARIGELGYLGLLNRGYGVQLQHCASSLTVSIALDLIGLLVVIFIIIGKQMATSVIEGWALAALVSALLLSVVALAGLFVITPLASRLVTRRYQHLPEKGIAASLVALLNDFSDSLQMVRRSGRTGQLVLVSVIIRILKYSGLYLLFLAVAGPAFSELARLPVEQVVSALIGGELGASLPIPTFMSFGAYEAGTAVVFQILGIADQAAALVTMLCVHIWSQSVEYLIGGALLALFILLQRRASALAEGAAQSLSPARARMLKWGAFATVAGIFVLGSSFLAWELRAAKKLGSPAAPAAGQVADNVRQWKGLSARHVSGLDGFVVFSSNRDGNHDIFRLNLSDFKLSKLTSHPHTETYPRISPDGKHLVFSRAHQPWVSQRNTVAWDIYVLDLASGAVVRVGKNGTAPHWLNNSQIAYLKNADSVVRISLDPALKPLHAEVLYRTGDGNRMPAGAKIHNPRVNPATGQLVFTGRQSQIGINTGHWGTAITNGNDHQGLYDGCEIGWTSDGKGLFQVTGGGRNNDLRIIEIDPLTFATRTMIDLAGEFSHEYWPKESSNGEYMVFGASRGPKEHEHDTEDYEIFLWKKGSSPDKATRLTFHTGNDNWPDVFIR